MYIGFLSIFNDIFPFFFRIFPYFLQKILEEFFLYFSPKVASPFPSEVFLGHFFRVFHENTAGINLSISPQAFLAFLKSSFINSSKFHGKFVQKLARDFS